MGKLINCLISTVKKIQQITSLIKSLAVTELYTLIQGHYDQHNCMLSVPHSQIQHQSYCMM